jgi:ZIP family zinc transporter
MRRETSRSTATPQIPAHVDHRLDPACYPVGLRARLGEASLLGYAAFRGFSDDVVAATMAVAAGAILAMLSDTMIPEAFESAHDFAGLITVAGFLAAFVLTKVGG